MDDESKLLLREIRDLQKQQLELLRAWLPPSGPRFRFSLRALLIALTLVAVFLGITTMLNSLRSNPKRITIAPPVPVIKK
jgi:hypothetical protein